MKDNRIIKSRIYSKILLLNNSYLNKKKMKKILTTKISSKKFRNKLKNVELK